MAVAKRGGGGGGGAAAAAGQEDESTTLASAIGNGEDLGTLIRAAFEIGRPEALLQQLKGFVKSKEGEIEELCRVHYEEFIRAVDELRNVLVDAEELKKRLADDNAQMQEVGRSLLSCLEELIQWHATRANVAAAVEALLHCSGALEACSRVNSHVERDELYPALKAVDCVERDYLQQRKMPATALASALEQHIPRFRGYVEKKVSAEFSDWLVDIRGVARDIGQLSMGAASSARQREEEMRGRQRQAEEQSRWGGGGGGDQELQSSCYVLLVDASGEEEEEAEVAKRLQLTPVYRAHYIHECLGLGAHFRAYYLDNRRLQLQSDLHLPPGPFLECHQSLFAQMAGFFIVEERVARTAGGLVDALAVESLWDTAVTRMASLVEEQLMRMPGANHILLVVDNASLLAATLRGYGYNVAPLLEALDRCRERYHELLLAERRASVHDVLANDKFEQMLLRKEYEYGMHVTAFGLQASDATPAFPYVAPFSASVPNLCRIVRSFTDDSVSFLSHAGGATDYYDAVRQYTDRLLSTSVAEALLRLVRSPTLGMSQAMQLAANLTVLERACDFFAAHIARSCGVPPRLAAPLQSRAVLRSSQAAAQERMLELVNSKIDDFMLLTAHIDWTPDDAPDHGNAYLNEVLIYLETLTPSAQAILPPHAFDRWIRGVLTHVSDCIVATFVSDDVRRFNVHSVMGVDADLRVLESFAHERFVSTPQLQGLGGGADLKSCLAEARQLVNLLLSNQPDLFLNPVIRERSYPALDFKKVMVVAEKYKDLPDRLFRGVVGGSKPVSKRKAFETLVKRLKEFV
ncbi:hypothetical protein SELMODRAFT_130996 [Selaginella moellendorffii]|uniref:Exocyst complex component n=1 Tax=Selaginella moellendorffii TaxID=88036 RepID=D8T378_SELML|nr:exocyst complex component SEC15B [Selaginella moellendorffii]EFJ08866.1 hypothetical protein SELMODRAFT_130996 [Selaginella moellendorffii]|eukprot:XP_002990043.1 exocyst complex component SEC15B [Selaginella moellendorffii]